jgi:hypothetical protein
MRKNERDHGPHLVTTTATLSLLFLYVVCDDESGGGVNVFFDRADLGNAQAMRLSMRVSRRIWFGQKSVDLLSISSLCSLR